MANGRKKLVEATQQKFPEFFNETTMPVILLAKLQHYGIQTRMLDLTDNALVALYFACKNHNDLDGEVLAFSAQPVSAYNKYANAIADTYRLTDNAYTQSKIYFEKVIKQPYCSDFVHWAKPAEEVKWLLQKIENPMFVEVGNVCERQKNQGGYFLLFPNKIIFDNTDLNYDVNKESMSSDDYYESEVSGNLVKFKKDNEAIVKRIIIPKEIKEDLIKQLSLFGITDEFLFADSIDEVCKSIKKKYKKYYS